MTSVTTNAHPPNARLAAALIGIEGYPAELHGRLFLGKKKEDCQKRN